jgi:hypothetical protein
MRGKKVGPFIGDEDVEILLGGRLSENRKGKNRRENETFRSEKSQ